MKIQQLTFTRFIAALAIVIYHYGMGSYLFNNTYISFIFQQANIGVSYFFMLSGFVMIIAYGNLENINFFQYIKNRLARIYPLYVLAVILIAGASLFKNVSFVDIILHLSMMQTWIPEKATIINPPGWSLSVELFFYLIFPLLANKFYSKLKLKTNTIWIILFWLISQIICNIVLNEIGNIRDPNTKNIHYPLTHLNEFLIGNLAGLFYMKYLKNQYENYSIPIIIFQLLLIVILKFPIGLNLHNGLLAIIFIPLILLISLSNDKITKLFARREFVFLGEISFGIYLLQVPVWLIFSDYRLEKYFGLDKEADFTLSFFIRLVILISLSTLTYLFFEKPMKKIIQRTYKKSEQSEQSEQSPLARPSIS